MLLSEPLYVSLAESTHLAVKVARQMQLRSFGHKHEATLQQATLVALICPITVIWQLLVLIYGAYSAVVNIDTGYNNAG